jgi:hypothetical protein
MPVLQAVVDWRFEKHHIDNSSVSNTTVDSHGWPNETTESTDDVEKTIQPRKQQLTHHGRRPRSRGYLARGMNDHGLGALCL